MGDGIGHVAVTGVALGLLTGTSPDLDRGGRGGRSGRSLIEVIRERGHTNGDVALALLFYGGLAGGVLLTGLGGAERAGSRSTSSARSPRSPPPTCCVTMALAAVVVVVCVGLAPQLFAVAQDQEFARVAGLNVRAYNLLVAVLAAVSVTVAMRTVGLLLVSALMVVPVATSQQLTRSFRTTLAAAMVLGTLASVGGLVISAFASFHARVAPGPTIVLLALAGFVGDLAARGVWLRHRAAAAGAVPRRRRPRRGARRPPTSTRTSTAATAATSPSRTATTSTTSTTATGTPSTGGTMTSTEPPAGPRACARPGSGSRSSDALASSATSAPRRRSTSLLGRRGETVGLATVYRTLQRLAEAGEVDMLRTEDGEAIYRRCSDTHHHHLVCRSCGATVEVEGPAVERWTRRDRRRARVRRRQPHPGDLRDLPRLPLRARPPVTPAGAGPGRCCPGRARCRPRSGRRGSPRSTSRCSARGRRPGSTAPRRAGRGRSG